MSVLSACTTLASRGHQTPTIDGCESPSSGSESLEEQPTEPSLQPEVVSLKVLAHFI